MGLYILAGTKINEDEDMKGAVLYCSTSYVALPWLFRDGEDATAFIERHGDIRRLTTEEQEKLYDAWVGGERDLPIAD